MCQKFFDGGQTSVTNTVSPFYTFNHYFMLNKNSVIVNDINEKEIHYNLGLQRLHNKEILTNFQG